MGLHCRDTIARVLLDRAARLPARDDSATSRHRAAPRRLAVKVAVLGILASSLCLLSWAPSASALNTHVFCETCSFGSPGEGAGELSSPAGVAVNSTTHDVYVADTGNKRIDEFSAGGTFMMAFGANVGGLGVDTCTLVCSAGTEGAEPGQFVSPTLIAVDNSEGPSEGDVYVGDTGDNIVTKFTAAGALIPGWGNSTPANGQLSGTFGEPAGIAVDSAGTLDVLAKEPHMVFEFSPEGALTKSVESFRGSRADGLAVDSEGDFFKVNGNPSVQQFTGSGGDVGQVSLRSGGQGEHEAVGVAADGTDLYIAEPGAVQHYVFTEPGVVSEPGGATCAVPPEAESAGCPATSSFGSSEPSDGGLTGGAGIAVDDSTGDVYVADAAANRVDVFLSAVFPDVATEPVSGLTGSSVTLNGTVDPDEAGEATCRFEWGTTKAFGNLAPCSQAVAEGASPVPVEANLSGLAPDTEYCYRLQASNKAKGTNPGGFNPGEASQDRCFTTAGLEPQAGSASAVTSESATLSALLRPGQEPTTFYFQYGTSAGYGSDAPLLSAAAPAGAAVAFAEGLVEVTPQPIHDLSAGTVYHYRVVEVLKSAGGIETLDGPDHTFTTQAAGGSTTGLTLADHRQWELVSPASVGAEILPIATYAPGTQAAASGDAIAYVTTAPTGAEPEGNSNFTQVLSSRGSDGWSSRDLAIPHSVATAFSALAPEYRVFSSDLSLSVAQPLGPFDPSVSGEASEQTGYLRTDFVNGEPSDFCTSSCYRPLVTGAAGFANVPPGVEFGANPNGGEKCPPANLCGPTILAATPDLSHIVLYYNPAALTPGGGGFYEWSAGQLQPVPGVGQGEHVGNGSGQVVEPTRAFAAVSADGSRVYFNGGVRVDIGTPQARTIPVPGGEFEAASVDGERAFVLGGEVLSEFDLQTETSTPLATGVQGVIGASDDGSSVYFVSNEALTPESSPGNCEKTVVGNTTAWVGTCGLYVYHAGQTAFIATLSGNDAPDWEGSLQGDGSGQDGAFTDRLTARVSPNGRWLAFMSDRSLTGYDNTDATSPAPCGTEKGLCDEEVYLYHAPAAGGSGGAGSLICASCNPTGARPHGVEYEHLNTQNGGLAGGNGGPYTLGVWNKSQFLAANVPGWTSTYHQSRFLSNEGRLFFNSSDALVPQDVNNAEDVYEYEPPSSEAEAPENDTCATTSSTYSPPRAYEVEGRKGEQPGGCISLVSSGTSSNESAFLDASEDGDDVFFLSSGQLTSQSRGALSVFDAHACTAASTCPAELAKPVECQGDACQASVPAPNHPTPGSLTFNGPTNLAPLASVPVKPKTAAELKAEKLAKALKACKQDKKKSKRQQCEKAARKKYGAAKKAKKATTDRRAR